MNNNHSLNCRLCNEEANFAIKREMARTPKLKVTLSNNVDDDIINNLSL